MNNTKRDFNGAAKFFLGLSMFATMMTIINSFLQISNMKMFGYVASDTLAIEIVIDFLILGAAVLTFLKKPAGLIALTALFIIRMFATIPWNGDTSAAYMLGGKMGYFIRDFGLFAIAMCFKKNGISGWKSMLASEDYLEKHTIIKNEEDAIPKSYDDESIIPEDHKDVIPTVEVDTASNILQPESGPTVQVSSVISSTEHEEIKHEIRHYEKEKEDAKSSPFRWKNFSKGLKTGILSGLGIIVALALLACIIGLKSYPEYINTYGDKIRYTFNLPNNNLASRLFKEMMDNRYQGQFFFDTDDGIIITASQYYDNSISIIRNGSKIDFNSVDAYLIKDTVRKKTDIDSSSLYTARWSYGFKWAPIAKGGGTGSYDYDKLIERDPNLVYIRLIPIDLVSHINEQEQRIETIASVPTSDQSIIFKMISHYVIKENYNRALDVAHFYLRYNKKNAELNGFTSFLHYMTQDLDEANELADYTLSLDPKEQSANMVKGCVAAERGDWIEAGKWSKKAIDYGSEVCEPYYIYAESLYQKGDTKLARDYYSKAFNKNSESPLAERYKHCGGLPFDFISMSFAFGKEDGSIITDYGEKLYSSKSQYILTKAKIKVLRVGDWDIQCKLFCRGTLSTGIGSPNGFSYDSTLYPFETGTYEQYIGCWGNSTPGNWPAGSYRFEIWYNGEKVGEESFWLY